MHTCTLLIGDQGSRAGKLLVPLEAAFPLCAYYHPNPFQPLVEGTLAATGWGPSDAPLPTHAEGDEVETAVLAAKSRKRGRTRRSKWSAHRRLLARPQQAAARWRRRQRSWTRSGQTQIWVSVPCAPRPRGPPARTVGRCRIKVTRRTKGRALLLAKRVIGLQLRALGELALFCCNPTAYLPPSPLSQPVLLWDVNGKVRSASSAHGCDIGQCIWGVSRNEGIPNRSSCPKLGIFSDLGDTWLDKYLRSDLIQLDQWQQG